MDSVRVFNFTGRLISTLGYDTVRGHDRKFFWTGTGLGKGKDKTNPLMSQKNADLIGKLKKGAKNRIGSIFLSFSVRSDSTMCLTLHF